MQRQFSWWGADTTCVGSDAKGELLDRCTLRVSPIMCLNVQGFGYLVLRRDRYLGRCSRGGVQGYLLCIDTQIDVRRSGSVLCKPTLTTV